MKKVLLSLVTAVMSLSAGYAYTITHSDYTSGASITAAGQNTNENNIVNVINGNIDNTNLSAGGVTGTNIANNTITDSKFVGNTITFVSVASGTIHGSTANSGGSQAQVTQGTISTPDLRANAVTISSSSDNTASLVGGTWVVLSSVTITTIGKPVLLMYSCALQFTVGSSKNANVVMELREDSVGIDRRAWVEGDSTNGSTAAAYTIPGNGFIIRTPTAASHTYALLYAINSSGTSLASNNGCNFFATEFRD